MDDNEVLAQLWKEGHSRVTDLKPSVAEALRLSPAWQAKYSALWNEMLKRSEDG